MTLYLCIINFVHAYNMYNIIEFPWEITIVSYFVHATIFKYYLEFQIELELQMCTYTKKLGFSQTLYMTVQNEQIKLCILCSSAASVSAMFLDLPICYTEMIFSGLACMLVFLCVCTVMTLYITCLLYTSDAADE